MSNSPYNPGQPELPELPSMEEAGVTPLRLRGTLAKALPAMPGGQLQDLYGSNYRAIAQAEESRDIGIANDYTKMYNKRSSAKAKARNRMISKAVENYPKEGYKSNRKRVGAESRQKKATTKWFARDVLGVGPDLYR